MSHRTSWRQGARLRNTVRSAGAGLREDPLQLFGPVEHDAQVPPRRRATDHHELSVWRDVVVCSPRVVPDVVLVLEESKRLAQQRLFASCVEWNGGHHGSTAVVDFCPVRTPARMGTAAFGNLRFAIEFREAPDVDLELP